MAPGIGGRPLPGLSCIRLHSNFIIQYLITVPFTYLCLLFIFVVLFSALGSYFYAILATCEAAC